MSLPPPSKLPLIEALYAALNSEFGVVLSTSDPKRLRAALYPLKAKDPDFQSLSFQLSRTAPETDLLIVKKCPED